MRKIKKIIIPILLILVALIVAKNQIFATGNPNTKSSESRQEILEGVVKKITKEEEREVMGRKQLYQGLKVFVTYGSLKGKTITIENGNLPIINLQKYKVGDEVKFSSSKDPAFGRFFYITDYIRRNTLSKLFAIFVVIVIIIAGLSGITSIIGMGFSLLVITQFILPQILDGKDPLTISILGSIIIVPITFTLSHGINKKTLAATIGTVIALFIAGILANSFLDASKLSGFASEEASFLQVYMGGNLDVRGLLLAGIIIGVLGVLDDITISQSSIVFQIKEVAQNLSKIDIYKKAMSVGKDHIASMVNTLMLVYTGAALPLLLLFARNREPYHQIIDYEMVAEEIVRTLVGSISLILAVPITTLIACLIVGKIDKSRKLPLKPSDKHQKE